MTPEFYLVLTDHDLHEQLENTVYEAGFDDSSLTMRGGHAAIWARDRPGEVTQVVREALAQARLAAIDVHHVEFENEAFA